MKLRYEGSIDDASDFWLFYQDPCIHPCGWAVEPQNKNRVIYKPPIGNAGLAVLQLLSHGFLLYIKQVLVC